MTRVHKYDTIVNVRDVECLCNGGADMIGTVIGDICGSLYEFDGNKNKDCLLFPYGCDFTDDTIMALAVAKSLIASDGDGEKLYDLCVQNMKFFGKKYPRPMGGYGGRFARWLASKDSEPYGSWGNGAAMRVGAVGFYAKSREEAERLAEIVTRPTHNSYHGIHGAQATAVCVWMAHNGYFKTDIYETMVRDYYPEMADMTYESIKEDYYFEDSCQKTVPQAITAFLDSHGFEDAIRNAISLGGDADTIGAITGAMAEAYYGVPRSMRLNAERLLDRYLYSVLKEFEELY